MITVQEQLHNALKLIDADTALIERQSKRIEELEAQLAAPEQSNSRQTAVKQPAQGERQPVAYALVMPDGIRQLYLSRDACQRAIHQWPMSYGTADIKPLVYA